MTLPAVSSSAAIRSTAAAPPAPPAVPLSLFVITNENETIANTRSGTGDSIAGTSTQTLTDAAGGFVDTSDRGQTIRIAGATNPTNNGDFHGTTAPTGTTFNYDNPTTGVVEASYTGAWNLLGRFSQIVDINAGKVFAQATPEARPMLAGLTAGKGTKNIWYDSAATIQQAFLELVDVPFAATFQGVDISVSWRVRYPVITAGNIPSSVMLIDDGGTGNTDILFGFSSSTVARVIWDDTTAGAATLSVTIPAVPANTWFTAGIRLNRATPSVTYFQNGVNIGTGATGTARAPVGLIRVVLGSLALSADRQYLGGIGAYAGTWSDANFLAVHNSFLSYGL